MLFTHPSPAPGGMERRIKKKKTTNNKGRNLSVEIKKTVYWGSKEKTKKNEQMVKESIKTMGTQRSVARAAGAFPPWQPLVKLSARLAPAHA